MENPLIHAVEVYDHHLDTLMAVEFAITGDVVVDDEELSGAVMDLVLDAHTAVQNLAARGRIARLNALWKAFQEEWARKHG